MNMSNVATDKVYPEIIDCIGLPSMILLPRGHVPINTSDQDLKSIIDYSLKADRLLGVIQPQSHDQHDKKLFKSGTLGKITTFVERNDHSYLVILSGLCRFDVIEELESFQIHHRLKVDYRRYTFDGYEETMTTQYRQQLIKLLHDYLSNHQIYANWDELEDASDEDIISSLTMICPFEPSEKQALLESATIKERCEMITAFMELAVFRESGQNTLRH